MNLNDQISYSMLWHSSTGSLWQRQSNQALTRPPTDVHTVCETALHLLATLDPFVEARPGFAKLGVVAIRAKQKCWIEMITTYDRYDDIVIYICRITMNYDNI